MPRSVGWFVAGLTLAGIAMAVAVAALPAPVPAPWWTLGMLTALLVAATWLVVPFRYGGSADAINLVEAALAPLLLGFPPLVVLGVVAVSQLANGFLRRLPGVKTAFNTAMWVVAAGAGALVLSWLGEGAVWPRTVPALVAALAAVGLVNNAAFSTVVALSDPQPVPRLVARFRPVVAPAWLGGWLINAALGVLYALAFVAAPSSAVLFFVPLVVLHLAYRSYSAARADQDLLITTHAAAAQLATSLGPLHTIPRFLLDLADCFAAPVTELVLRDETGGRIIYRAERATGACTQRIEVDGTPSLAGAAVEMPGAVRAAADGSDAIARALAAAGATTCLAAPLHQGERMIGALLVLDRGGFQGSKAGEVAVLEGVARETAGALAKGELVAAVLDERRKLAEIIHSTSDGILTLDGQGRVMTWNHALEAITGWPAATVLGRADIAARLELRDTGGRPATLTAPLTSLPHDVHITTAAGGTRHLACSYSAGPAPAEGAALIVIARDVTPADEQEALQESLDRLVEAEAERRLMVEQLQQAVLPAPLVFEGGTTAATYEPSDPSAPTGGDLYDWQVLSDGDVQLTVVDVLGHGVAATKDALAVVHTLRVLTAAGVELVSLVKRADELLQVQRPELVATVIIARCNPSTGRLRVVSGGHPPALIVTPRREVRQVAASGGAIGWPGAGSDDTAETLLEPGDALIMYTDGLVEARKNILDGMDDLARHAADVVNLPAAELADELVARALAGAQRRDDTLALVLRREFANAPDDRESWAISPDLVAARQLRHELMEWLSRHSVSNSDVLMVAWELLANAVRAARLRVTLHVSLFGDGIVIDVSDDGTADLDLPQRGAARPPLDAERGRGLYVVRSVSTHVNVLATADGTTVRAVLPGDRDSQPEPSGAGRVRPERQPESEVPGAS